MLHVLGDVAAGVTRNRLASGANGHELAAAKPAVALTGATPEGPFLAKKLAVFRGAIDDPLADEAQSLRPVRASFDDKPFSAIVIGSQLFRKGGANAIAAFERLRARGLDVRLTLIGDFEPWCYALRECTPDAQAWREREHKSTRSLTAQWIEPTRDWLASVPDDPRKYLKTRLLGEKKQRLRASVGGRAP